ncbi:unnamed protein product [Ixodes pacificus]
MLRKAQLPFGAFSRVKSGTPQTLLFSGQMASAIDAFLILSDTSEVRNITPPPKMYYCKIIFF